MKRVYIEQGWREHPYYRTFALHPPEGYEFVLGAPSSKHLVDVPGGTDLVRAGVKKSAAFVNRWVEAFRGGHLAHWTQHQVLERMVPLNLAKSYLDLRLRPLPPGTDLVFAMDHLTLRPVPWILQTEHVAWLLSYRGEWLKSARLRRFVETVLSSPWCRKIVSFLEVSQESFSRYLNCEGFRHKFVALPLAIPARPFGKVYRSDGKVKLLLVGTTQVGTFYEKGGEEALECFRILRQRYPHLELVVRSEAPPEVTRRYGGLPGLRILDSPISAEALAAEFGAADIFLFPSRVHVPYLSILEAMSYELPVVALDLPGIRDLVRNGETGLLVAMPGAAESASLQDVVGGLVELLPALLEDASLRERLGKAGRREVEEGGHSIIYRNQKLKEVLDEATADLPARPILAR